VVLIELSLERSGVVTEIEGDCQIAACLSAHSQKVISVIALSFLRFLGKSGYLHMWNIK
jgi:hypothetical protein